MNKPINCRKFFLWLGIVLISAALSFRGYVEYQKRVHNLNLQIGHSLYPVVSDYFSWSKEEPLKPGELPKRGEFYSYRRPDSAAKKPMEKFYQRLSGGRTATKQCHGISEDGLLWDTGSDDKWVPVADIVGHVVEIYDSRYKELSGNPLGRFTLWAERNHLEEDMVWVEDSYLAVDRQGAVEIYRCSGKGPIKVFDGWELFRSPGKIVMHRVGTEWGESGFMLYYPQSDVVVYPVDKDGGTLPDSEAFIGRIPDGGD